METPTSNLPSIGPLYADDLQGSIKMPNILNQ